MKRITVVCEGRSEYVYLKNLQRFLETQSDDWDFPLQVFPDNRAETNGGDYRIVVSNYKDQRRGNRRAQIEVWVDYDLYVRNDRENMTKYQAKPPGIPDFKFSFHNFEDFLVMHMEDETVERWRSIFGQAGHFKTPLHSCDYIPLLRTLIPEYKKGELSVDITAESLKRLKRNQNMLNPLGVPPDDLHFGSFAVFLIKQIEEAYPELLA